MSRKLIDEFYWYDLKEQKSEALTDIEKYQRVASWAAKARGQNPNVFDVLTEWILDDSEWTEDKLAENEQILMQGISRGSRIRMHSSGIPEGTGAVGCCQ
jgi:hypothetical protein